MKLFYKNRLQAKKNYSTWRKEFPWAVHLPQTEPWICSMRIQQFIQLKKCNLKKMWSGFCTSLPGGCSCKRSSSTALCFTSPSNWRRQIQREPSLKMTSCSKQTKNWPYFLKQEPWFSSSLVSPLPLLQVADIPPAASGSRTVWSQWRCLRSGWKCWTGIKWQFSALLKKRSI